ncbi:MAG: Spy/CpxP family protein refolding chaperone [Vicinamibacterales bacterium]
MRNAAVGFLMLFTVAAPARAQQPGDDPIAQALFPPELIMKYQEDVGLDEAQARAIKEVIQQAQTRFLEMQWQMQAESAKLVKLLNARPTDEAAVLAQLEKMLNTEREVKRTQISLLIRIKNRLTDAQLARLAELRKKDARP